MGDGQIKTRCVSAIRLISQISRLAFVQHHTESRGPAEAEADQAALEVKQQRVQIKSKQ